MRMPLIVQLLCDPPLRKGAIYVRISSDVEVLPSWLGGGRGVRRQRPAGVFGQAQPAYERMLADLRDGERDAVIVYHVEGTNATEWALVSRSRYRFLPHAIYQAYFSTLE